MVWLVEKKIFRHVLDLGIERVEIPVRVKFEFEIREGSLVPETMAIHSVYNKHAFTKRYPEIELSSLDKGIEKTVQREIQNYLEKCGFLGEENDLNSSPRSWKWTKEP